MGNEIKITYETLFELLMREKNREELQKLEPDFLESLGSYLLEKKQIAISAPGKLDYFSVQEKEKTEKQLQNIFRILKEFYDRREKKIVNLAIVKSRTASDVLDTSGMLDKEEMLFAELVQLLDRYRKDLLLDRMNATLSIEHSFVKPESPRENEFKAAIDVGSSGLKQAKKEWKEEEEEEEEEEENTAKELSKKEAEKGEAEGREETSLIRFLHAVPKFLGKNLEVYGPFEEEDVANLPADIAEILIKKGRAERFGAA